MSSSGCLSVTFGLDSKLIMGTSKEDVSVEVSAVRGLCSVVAEVSEQVSAGVSIDSVDMEVSPSVDSVISVTAAVFCPFIIIRSFNFDFSYDFA